MTQAVCGVVGVIGRSLPSESQLLRMRDAMTHRGPDDAGLWFGESAALGHRRLAIRGSDVEGHQPMATADGRFVLAYNGEIYNEEELRDAIGGDWRGGCDTETLLRWLAEERSLREVRGMYAFAIVDTHTRTLTLSRDPLGIKPMFWAVVPGGVVFGSEIQALFQHPALSPEPDPLGVSMYMSSVRPVMQRQTLFQGVQSLVPGETLVFDLDEPSRPPRSCQLRINPAAAAPSHEELASEIDESVQKHLRSDVSVCALLSGGLDSTIIVDAARGHSGDLRTYCSGAIGHGGDPEVAERVASCYGTIHTAALLDEAVFEELWFDSIQRTGLPLATPNEVAIRLIARTLRRDGQVVALSGEGADELFAGYEGPLRDSCARGTRTGGQHELDSNGWMTEEVKAGILQPSFADAKETGLALIDLFDRAFEHAGGGAGPEAHLRFQRAINLPMLLHRFDSATMLESVEGRTPFADSRVASMAASCPIASLFDPVGESPATTTKLALRQAFAARLPAEALSRPKASFPVPFQHWMNGAAVRVRASRVAKGIFRGEMVDAICQNHDQLWHLAWPVFNLVLWAERWWGSGTGQASAASILGTAESKRFV